MMKQLNSGTRTATLPPLFSLLLCLIMTALATDTALARAQTLTLPELLQQVLNHYPSLQSAALQVERAQQDTVRVESRLGWQLAAQTGIHKDVSLFGSAVNRINVGSQATRQLISGDTLSMSANISHDDADTATLPSLANPVTATQINLLYRKPLTQGKGNNIYNNALTQADSNYKIQQARQQLSYDQIAMQLIELYAATLTTQQRINNIQQSIKRSQRLQQFILDRVELGIAEDKDRLQTSAQLDGLKAQKEALELAHIKQSIALNRLMAQPWNTTLTLKLAAPERLSGDLDTLIKQASSHSPALKINDARIAISDSLITLQRDQNRDKVDMVLSLGNSSQSGTSQSGSVNQSELVGGLQIEYTQSLDQRGNKAALNQAQLDRSIALQDRKQLNDDLHYDVAMLMAELKASQTAIKAYLRSVKSEHKKLDEAEQRYRQGRITIDQVIQFENQTAGSELGLALQKIEYQRSNNQLELLRGRLWDGVSIPPNLHQGGGE